MTDIREGRDCDVFKSGGVWRQTLEKEGIVVFLKRGGSFGQQVQLHKKEGFTVFLIKEGWCLATGSVTLEKEWILFFQHRGGFG